MSSPKGGMNKLSYGKSNPVNGMSSPKGGMNKLSYGKSNPVNGMSKMSDFKPSYLASIKSEKIIIIAGKNNIGLIVICLRN